ncbi:hypothetical protein CEXT_170921 [Caerostris extrusa]|uniref:Uncharacterized protein n=1 Tax=Caerostris extrusa TaxID=172846 RepID=A0AAV4XUM4_CAEEX|nr:hypothetical protein CEXT_170921 [Caerostris extrusa]
MVILDQTFLTSGLSGLTIQNSFCEESADIPGEAQPTRPAIAQVPLILQQFHRIRRAGRISGYRGSDALQHLSQPADVPPTRLVQIMDEASYGGALTTNCCMSTSSSSEQTLESVPPIQSFSIHPSPHAYSFVRFSYIMLVNF